MDFLKKNKYVLKFSSFHLISSFAFAMFIPFLSLILIEKGLTTGQITYFFAIFTFGIFFFSPIIGKLSDNIGRHKIILAGLSFEILSLTSYYFITNIYFLYTIRFFDAIAYSGIFFVMIGAFEKLIEDKKGFWLGLYFSIGTIGSIMGPIIAGFIVNFSTNKMLLLISSFLIIITIIFFKTIPEKKSKKIKINSLNFKQLNPIFEIKNFLKFKQLKGMALLGILMNSKSEIYNIFFPILIIKTLKLPYSYLGFLLSIPIFFHIFQFYFGKISDNISAEFGIILGIFLSSLSLFFLPYVNNLIKLIVLLIFYGIGGSIWNINAWALMGNIAQKYDMQGEIVGTYISISKIGVFIATLTSAYIVNKFGIEITLQLFSISIILTIPLIYFLFEPIFHHKSQKNILHKIINTNIKKTKN